MIGRVLDVVIMIDGSDSFDEAACKTGSGFDKITEWIYKFLHELENETNFDAIFATCYQFSGLKQAGPYIEGSYGKDERSNMLHYERFFGPQNISTMSQS